MMTFFIKRAYKNLRSWFHDNNAAMYAAMHSPPRASSSSRDSSEENDDLGESLIEKNCHSNLPPLKYREPWWKNTTPFVVMHVLVFTIYALILFVVINKQVKGLQLEGMPVCSSTEVSILFTIHTKLIEAPAVPVLRWEAHKFTLEDRIQEKGFLSGKPNADLDKAWHDLLNCQSSEFLNNNPEGFSCVQRRKHTYRT
jgi:hypothetical protein